MRDEEHFIGEYQKLIAHAPNSALIRGMIRMAEDAADDGDQEFAETVWEMVLADLTNQEEWMRLSMIVGNGNKMIGIEPDHEAQDRYLKIALGAAA